MAVVGLRNLCTPAYVYLVISLVAIAVILIQNILYGDSSIYCIGTYSCSTSSIIVLFVLKVLYVLFWTWILNLICKNGMPGVAWAVMLFPYIIAFVLVIFYMMV